MSRKVSLEEKYDIYISYDFNSKSKVRNLYEKLTAYCDYKVWLDDVEIDLNKNITKQLLNGVKQSKIFVCCLSNEYTFSDTSVEEIALAQELKKPFIVLILEDDKDLFSYLNSATQDQFTVFNCFEDSYFFDHLSGELFESIVQTINEYISLIKSQRTKKMKTNLPDRNKNFVGRESHLERLEDQLVNSKDQLILITGLSGCGKSDLALEFAYRKRQTHFKSVRWFNGDSIERIDIEFKVLAIELGLEWCINNKELYICLLFQMIQRMSFPVLFIFDNVKQINDLKEYLTNLPINLKLILTSKKSNLIDDENLILRLDLLKAEEADEYLKSQLRVRNIAYDNANDLIRYMQMQEEDILPFYLNEVTCFLKETRSFRLGAYIELLNTDSNKDILEDGFFELEKCENAWIIYQYSAYLDNDFINLEIFKELLPMLEEKDLYDTFKLLEQKGCMKIVNERGISGFRMHKLKQEELIKFMKKYPDISISPKEIYLVLFETLSKLFPCVNKHFGSNWIRAKFFYFHSKKLLKNYKSVLDRESDSIALLYSKVADFNRFILLKYKEALINEEIRLKICTNLFELNQDVIDSHLKIGQTFLLLNDTKNAIFYLDKALRLNQEHYPSDLHVTALCYYNIGLAYQKIGEFKSELNFKEQALKFYSQNNDNIKIAEILDDLSKRLLNKSDHETALKYSLRSLNLKNEYDEQNLPSIAKTLYNIGMCYYKEQNYDKSIEFHEQSIQLRQLLEQENKCCKLEVAQSMNAVGLCYRNIGELMKGFELLDQEVQIRKDIFDGVDPAKFKFNENEDVFFIHDD